MEFASDNTVGASPKVLQAIVDANPHALPSYGADRHTQRALARLGEVLACDPAVFLVSTGTASNALGLAALTPSGGIVFCHAHAHIIEEECAAPEFFIGSGKLVGIAGSQGKIHPDGLRAALDAYPRSGFRQAHPACLSLSQATESGTLYSLDEIAALSRLAHEAGLWVHMDGARFGNAVAALGCSPADLSHRAGVDVLSFGTTKNGTLGCEAVVIFDKQRHSNFPVLQKRAGHIVSKSRFLGAQMEAFLDGGHWLDLARHANAAAARLATGLKAADIRLPWSTDANEVFAVLPHRVETALADAGAHFHRWESNHLADHDRPSRDEAFVRFVCSFATSFEEVDRAVAIVSMASRDAS